MSSPDVRRSTLGLLAALALLGAGGCTAASADPTATSEAAPATTPAPHDVSADGVTGSIAAVEFARQCAVTGQAFADESAFTTDLDSRLGAVGLTHAQWKDWHDALAGSPELLAQLAKISAPGCPAA